jgi:predicted ATPase
MCSLHLKSVTLHPETYPDGDRYPFNLPIFRLAQTISFSTPVTLFVGENGTGKSTLLEAISQACGIYIWRDQDRKRYQFNPYEDAFHHCLSIEWTDGSVPGSFFGSDIFHHFAQLLDEWAANDPGQLEYFGGKSLMAQSHGQSVLSFFKSRYQRKGLYLVDEPETALSPRSQLELLQLLDTLSRTGQAQFIMATHSPLLLACPGAVIYSFDDVRINKTHYEETAHYKLYKSFLDGKNRDPLRDT